jgi:hypothetical protein
MSTLADVIRKRRSSGQSRTGSLIGSLKDKFLETIDPRQFLDQSGILTALFPSLRKYEAGGTKSDSGSSLIKKRVELLRSNVAPENKQLDAIAVNTEIIAKNSLSLPGLSRDMNVMRQNIIKLVQSLDVAHTNKADAFFKESSEREAEFESQFGNDDETKEESSEPKPESFISSILGLMGKIISPIISIFKTIFGTVLTTIKTALSLIVAPLKGIITGAFTSLAFLLTEFVGTLLKKILNLFSIIKGASFLQLILGGFFKTPIGRGLLLGTLVAMGFAQLASDYRKGRANTERARELQSKISSGQVTQEEIEEYVKLVDKEGTFVSEQQSRERALKSRVDKNTAEFILNNINSDNEEDRADAEKELRILGVSSQALKLYYDTVYGGDTTHPKAGMTLARAAELVGERQILSTEPKISISPEMSSGEDISMNDVKATVGGMVTPSPERDNNQGSLLNQGFKNFKNSRTMSENPQAVLFKNQNNNETNQNEIGPLPTVYNDFFIFNYLTPSETN